ncbi:MAG: YicC/YloC family endoribonuclease [Rhodothermales bacterium]|nr:YicC/YloC family endoribonuclease [Rhodothermales bacterium]
MISSMTGFGRSTAESDAASVTVEVKSVNSRFCEVAVRGPRSLSDREIDIQNLIKQSVPRGRITVHVQVEYAAGVDAAVKVNHLAAATYRDALVKLAADLSLDDPVRLDHLLRFPEVVERSESTATNSSEEWPLVRQALEQAVAELNDMRQQEGHALRDDLLERLLAIEKGLGEVNERAPQRVEEARVRLTERLTDLLDEQRVDKDRLEFEIALLAEKLDVNEEAVRLASHIQLFREALETAEPVGRKLNFISQEINREINTIGSKSNDAELARIVVGMKEELEKVREQIENVQ